MKLLNRLIIGRELNGKFESDSTRVNIRMPKPPFQNILYSPFINRVGLYLGEILSPRLGNWVVKLITNRIARRQNNEQVKAVKNNQWIVSGKQLSGKELDDRVWQVYYSSAKSLYDYFHCLRKEDRVRELIQFDDNLQYFLKRVKNGKDHTLGLVLHMGAFDLCGYAIALQGARPLVLSYPNPNPTYLWHNELRKKAGLSVEPLTMESFQQATRLLRQGGAVITGVDRPWSGGQHQPMFFGISQRNSCNNNSNGDPNGNSSYVACLYPSTR